MAKGGGFRAAASSINKQTLNRASVQRVFLGLALCGIFFLGVYKLQVLRTDMAIGCSDDLRATR